MANAIPAICDQLKRSLNTTAAIIIMKGNSSCTTMTAVDAFNPSRPVNVNAYWMVALTTEIQNILRINPNGGFTNQSKTRVVSAKRKAISRIGGKSLNTKATLARVKPKPHMTGTLMARMMSTNRKLVPVLLVYKW